MTKHWHLQAYMAGRWSTIGCYKTEQEAEDAQIEMARLTDYQLRVKEML